LNLLAVVIQKSKRNVADKNDKVVHPRSRATDKSSTKTLISTLRVTLKII